MAYHRKKNVRTLKTATPTSQIPQNNPSEESEADAAEVGGLKFFAYGEVFCVFIWMFSLNANYFEKTCEEFPKIWNFSTIELLNFAAPVFLFIELVALVFRWMIATQHEFDMWKSWLKNPFTPIEQKAALIVFPLVLGVLPAFPNQIVFISGFMAVYSFSNYWTQWLCNDHFHRALQKTQKTSLDKVTSGVLTVMEHFWLKRPQLGRIATMIFFNSIAFSLALAGAVQQEPQRHRYQLSAYAILILVLLITEIIIARWRYKLDQDIQQIKMAKEEANDT
jgi:hypothetical protein